MYRAGKENSVADALSRAYCAATDWETLQHIHERLCHPGVTRLNHFIRVNNLPYSLDEVKKVVSACKDCSEVKPQYVHPPPARLIKATQPFERLNMDFKGPLPSHTRNKFILIIVDEFSRFTFHAA